MSNTLNIGEIRRRSPVKTDRQPVHIPKGELLSTCLKLLSLNIVIVLMS